VLFTDQNGDPVTGLTKYHFRLREKVDPDPYAPVSSDSLGMGSSRESKSVVLLIDDTPSMNSNINYLKAAIADTILGSSFGYFDTAMFVTFASMNPGAPRVKMYPPDDIPPNGYLTSDRADLQAYLNLIPIFSSPGYSAVHDAIGFGMEDMMAQAADEMRGLNAVIAFTDTNPSYYFDGAWRDIDVLDYASMNEILIYTIGEKYADPGTLPQFANLGYSTSGYYRYANNPGEYSQIYAEVLDLMHSALRYLYKVSWFTSATGGEDLDIEIQVNYSTETGGDFSDADTELNYGL